jgi:hypothetical protein
LNVCINVKSLPSSEKTQKALEDIKGFEKRLKELDEHLSQVLSERGGLDQA